MLAKLLSQLRFPSYNAVPPIDDLLFVFWHPCSRIDLNVRHQVLATVWETGLTDKELEDLATFDGVAVPTHWHRDYLFSKSFSKPVAVIPIPEHGAKSQERSIRVVTEALFRFSNVGKFESRKGPEILVQTCALLDQMDHLLVHKDTGSLFHGTLLWNNPFIPDWEKQAEALFLKYEFREVPAELTRNGNLSLEYRARRFISPRGKVELTLIPDRIAERSEVLSFAIGDNCVGFYPTKAEGWGMPIWEGYVNGLPMVCPNHRGISEYFNKDVFIEIPIVGEEVANDGVFFHGDRGTWGVIDPQDCANILSQLLTSRDFHDSLLGCTPYSYSSILSNLRDTARPVQSNVVAEALYAFFRTVRTEL